MFSAIKFLTGFNIFDGERLAKLIFYFILITIGIGAYHKLFLSKSTVINKPQQVIIEAKKEPPITILKLWRLRVISIDRGD